MNPCTMCGGQGISFCKECDLYKGEYIEKSVLENIKAEMKQIQEAENQIYGSDTWNFVGKCLDIIDKYKAESEVDNGNDD